MRREIYSHDGSGGTYLLALAARTTLLRVDVRQIALDGNSPKRTLLLTLAATDTSGCTCLLGSRPLVAIDTADIHTSALRPFLANLDDVTRTCLGTSSTSGTEILVNLGQTSLRVDGNSPKLTGIGTVATTKAAESTGSLTGCTGIHCRTCAQSAILCRLRAVFTRAVTSHHSHHRLGVSNSHT